MLRQGLRCRNGIRAISQHVSRRSANNAARVSAPLDREEIEKLLAQPSWSVKSLQEQKTERNPADAISQQQLRHLLRLSALPMPASTEEESAMIATLESQLHFVRAIQSVDTQGVAPLAAIRDETEAAKEEDTLTVDSLKDDLDKEEQVGVLRRIVIKKASKPAHEVEGGAEDIPAGWDPLEAAPSTKGRFISVPKTTSGTG